MNVENYKKFNLLDNKSRRNNLINFYLNFLKRDKLKSEKIRIFKRKIFKILLSLNKEIKDKKERLFLKKKIMDDIFNLDWIHFIELNKKTYIIYKFLYSNITYLSNMTYCPYIIDIEWTNKNKI